MNALKIHAALEEEIFYPAVRQRVGKNIMNEADEEHHIAEVLIAELEAMDGVAIISTRSSMCWPKTFRTTSKKKKAKCCRRRTIRTLDFVKLGQRMLRRKEELLVSGLPAMTVASYAQKTAKARKASQGLDFTPVPLPPV